MSVVIALQNMVAANGNTSPKRLVDGIGVNAVNLDNRQSDFRGLRAASLVHTLTGYGSQQDAIYRMGRDAKSDTQYWLAFDADVDFARSMLASDPLERTYGTGGSFTEPSYTDNTFLTSPPYPTPNGSGFIGYLLGIPAPASGMTASVAVAGSGATEARVYLSTYIRANGDESAPSQPVSISCQGGSTVNLLTLPAAPGSAAAIGISHRRFYVSKGGDFQECSTEVLAATSSLDAGARGAVLQTGGSTTKYAWLPPPTDAIGIIELWGGMHGMHNDKGYATCVPFKPHAWPLEYRRIVPDKIVGTAKWGQNWLLATSGLPRVVMGTTPLAMVDSPINFRQACVSKRSVRSVGHGVCWASASGLCYHGQKGTMIITERLLTKAQWQAMIPESIIGAAWGEWYVGFYDDGAKKGFMINTHRPDGVIWLTQGAYAVFEDTISDNLYLLDSGNTIKKWDAGSVASATFKSRVFRHPNGACPGAARIVATTYPVTFSMWADGVLKVNAQSVTTDDPIRLPGGYWAEEFQVEISGTGPVEGVFVAEEIADLP